MQPAQREEARAWTAAVFCLATVHRPEAWPAHCSVLPSMSVKCQNKSICKGNRLSLEYDGWEKPPLGFTRWSLGHLWNSWYTKGNKNDSGVDDTCDLEFSYLSLKFHPIRLRLLEMAQPGP